MSSAGLQVFQHCLYEYSKGVRGLCMVTVTATEATTVVEQLVTANIDHYLQHVNETKTNVFFGRASLVETTRQVVKKPLNRLSPEEDFILGILLGYDPEQQCQRFLARTR